MLKLKLTILLLITSLNIFSQIKDCEYTLVRQYKEDKLYVISTKIYPIHLTPDVLVGLAREHNYLYDSYKYSFIVYIYKDLGCTSILSYVNIELYNGDVFTLTNIMDYVECYKENSYLSLYTDISLEQLMNIGTFGIKYIEIYHRNCEKVRIKVKDKYVTDKILHCILY